MGWSIAYDSTWDRDIGYGVPAFCDHPECNAEIDRGLAYVCGGEPHGGEHGCGLFFCGEHMLQAGRHQRCPRCAAGKPPYQRPKPDHPDWIRHKLTDPSWAPWRSDNPKAVAALRAALETAGDLPGTRPMTEREVAQAAALNRCSLVPASPPKRFIRSLSSSTTATEITERQAKWLEALAWRYRRQMPRELVPSEKPERFE